MRIVLLTVFALFTMGLSAQNLLTQNPSFETYTGTTPDGWVADEALMEV